MDEEIMEAVYENTFHQQREILEDTYQDQQVEDLCTAENDGRQGFISDLFEIKDEMQENDVPISDSDKVKPDLELKCDDE